MGAAVLEAAYRGLRPYARGPAGGWTGLRNRRYHPVQNSGCDAACLRAVKQPERRKNTAKFCANCGAPVTGPFCTGCGKAIQEGGSQAQASVPTQNAAATTHV